MTGPGSWQEPSARRADLVHVQGHSDGDAEVQERARGLDAEDVGALAHALPQALGPFSRVARRAVRRGFPWPLPDAQVCVLRTVEAAPGIGTAAVAEPLPVAPNTVSTLVGELVAAGLLVRTRSETDQRATSLSLTDHARAELLRWEEGRDRVLAGALEQLTAAERAALAGALPAVRRLLEVLERS